MTSNALHALFLRAIARGADGQYRDPEARALLADVAGECCGLKWLGGGNWASDGHDVPPRTRATWNHHGRLAPLVSLDAANAVKMPVGWRVCAEVGEVPNKAMSVTTLKLDGHSNNGSYMRFDYTHPDDFAAAYLSARVYAVLRDREQV